MSKYALGVDFGTLSGRAVLLDLQNGAEIATAEMEYPHGVMDQTLPDGTKLGHDWALQHPQDYVDVLTHVISKVIKESNVKAEDIIGVGVDFTACTVLPVKADGTPLCLLPAYQNQPHAYVKLWKHHAAQDKANQLNEIARVRNEEWLDNYGGKISSEWAIPKLMQIVDESPEIYQAMDRFIEAADWIVWQMTGVEKRSAGPAGYKEIWNKRTGFPSKAFFAALDPRMENVVAEKLSTDILELGSKAGEITSEMAKKTGLLAGTAVAVGNIDAHVCAPTVGIDGPGKMFAIIGTSSCHMLMGEKEVQVPGICGVVEGGLMPGYFGYEAGQSCVGDHFAWFVKNCCPAEIKEQAEKEKMPIQAYLTKLAEKQKPGESGLVALDWWNGNRSVLVDVDLTGVMLGMTLQTRPEEMYRALLEATAYGTRMIVETYREHDVPINAFYATGGISQKNALMMQIYADVLNMPIYIAESVQGAAVGAAMFGATAAGEAAGGFASVIDAARKLGRVKDHVYQPIAQNVVVYDQLFAEYKILHDYFGRGANDVMKRLKALKKEQNKV